MGCIIAEQGRAGRCLCILCLSLLCDVPQSVPPPPHRSRPCRRQAPRPCLRLAGGAEQPETTEEMIVRRAREQELAMLAEEEGNAAGQGGPAPSCPLAAADLVRRAHEQEMSMLANETREEQRAKRARECGEAPDSCDATKRHKTLQRSPTTHLAAVDTEQLVRLALTEELQMLVEEAREAETAGAQLISDYSARAVEGGISERTRRLLLQAHNEEMMMLELEGQAVPKDASVAPQEAGWRRDGAAAEAHAAGPSLVRDGGQERDNRAEAALPVNASRSAAAHTQIRSSIQPDQGQKAIASQHTTLGNCGREASGGGGRGGVGRREGEGEGLEGIGVYLGEGTGGGGSDDRRKAMGARGGGVERSPTTRCGLCIGAKEGEEGRG